MKKSVYFPTLVLLIVAMLAWPAAVSASLAGQSYQASHVIQAGETLSRIAARYGVTANAIQAANNIANANRIYAGMTLQIPTAGYVVSGGGTLASPIVNSPGISSQPGNPVGGCASPYIVQPGDTLSGVAARCGVSLTSLASANGLSVTSMIFVGQRLYLSGSARSTTIPVKSSSGAYLPNTGGSSGCSNPYTVSRNDTLSDIARLCRVSIANLKQWNHLITDMIWIGQSLKTRGSTSGYQPPAVVTVPALAPDPALAVQPPAPADTPEPEATPAAPIPDVVIPPSPTPRIEPTVAP
ncbi:MAG: hypothetical protein CVU38_11015 [Chloroflexi bacterium HGW-Chloroflexi-1]|nr:MAG: hypothetical protein CVU38_11015 [Chloroflexi bacterium HGW-Chloroflexi-1]